MRPDRVADIECDEFGNFPNIAYARSFVLMYAKYLHVDVADSVQGLQTATRVGIDDYAYLQNAPDRIPHKVRTKRQTSALPVFVLIGLVFLAFFIMYLIRQGDRLGPEYQGVSEQAAPVILSDAPAATPVPVPVETAAPTVAPAVSALPQLRDAPAHVEPEAIDNLPVKKAVPLSGN